MNNGKTQRSYTHSHLHKHEDKEEHHVGQHDDTRFEARTKAAIEAGAAPLVLKLQQREEHGKHKGCERQISLRDDDA